MIERFIRGENCLEWLQDMQRALRRDDDATRDIACKLGAWKVVETKLVPLLLECRDDLELVVTLTKIFVMLTMPLSPYVKKWAAAHANPGQDPELGGGSDGIKRRMAAKNQVTHLLSMKRALAKEEVVAVLVATLEEPLSRGAARTEEDKLVIELVLTLLRNMLCIEDLCKGVGAAGGAEEEMADALLHAELLCIFDREYVFDVILFLCQGIQAPENAPWNLLLMEILFHLYKDQDPADVAMVGPRPASEEEEAVEGGEGSSSNSSSSHKKAMGRMSRGRATRRLLLPLLQPRRRRRRRRAKIRMMDCPPFSNKNRCLARRWCNRRAVGTAASVEGCS